MSLGTSAPVCGSAYHRFVCATATRFRECTYAKGRFRDGLEVVEFAACRRCLVTLSITPGPRPDARYPNAAAQSESKAMVPADSQHHTVLRRCVGVSG